ncbi:hypothetical protein DERF_001635 [Dermatophagoides farinae]|uniref:F-box domain-containing protein n=1 Tax=Dermatophagoides farinae TaxID=6954 RepID=A0A922IBA1_DERFA|nr:hypothetical protein DERF_001635 [Dermatophagoides farinae]
MYIEEKLRQQQIESEMLPMKPQRKPSRKQLLYQRRSQTTPHYMLASCSSNSTLPTRFPIRTIKCLNFHCLSKVFEYVDFKDLINCQLVCSFWNECVKFHLAKRTYFAYGKQYNDLQRMNYDDEKEFQNNTNDSNTRDPLSLSLNSFYSCEKCQAIINAKIAYDRDESNNYAESKSSGLSSTSENLSSSSSLSASQTSLTSSSDSVIDLLDQNNNNTNGNYNDYRCAECQAIFEELKTFTTKTTNNNNNNNSDKQIRQNYYDQFIDAIRLNIFERILSKLPKLRLLKYAQGYRYGFQHNCLDVYGVNLILRTNRHCPHLTNIDLSNCVGLTEADFYQLAKFYGQQLISLNVSGCRIDETCLRLIIKSCDKLRYLNMANNFCRLQGTCLEWISDKIETIVADYNQNVRVLDGLLQGKGRNIIELELNVGYCFNPSMPYKILGNHFQNLISLKIIFKSFGKYKQGIFIHLAKLKELECLYLIEEIDDFDSESSLDDFSVLEILKSCGSKLRELYLHAASSLFGCQSSLTDHSISKIDTFCPLLEVFSIKRASITDQSLNSIARLRNAYTVQLIDLEYISDKGIRQIMTSFRENEDQHKQKLRQICGIDIDVGHNGPNIEQVKRN